MWRSFTWITTEILTLAYHSSGFFAFSFHGTRRWYFTLKWMLICSMSTPRTWNVRWAKSSSSCMEFFSSFGTCANDILYFTNEMSGIEAKSEQSLVALYVELCVLCFVAAAIYAKRDLVRDGYRMSVSSMHTAWANPRVHTPKLWHNLRIFLFLFFQLFDETIRETCVNFPTRFISEYISSSSHRCHFAGCS